MLRKWRIAKSRQPIRLQLQARIRFASRPHFFFMSTYFIVLRLAILLYTCPPPKSRLYLELNVGPSRSIRIHLIEREGLSCSRPLWSQCSLYIIPPLSVGTASHLFDLPLPLWLRILFCLGIRVFNDRNLGSLQLRPSGLQLGHASQW